MSGSSSHDSPSRKQHQEDALDGASSSATSLGRTLDAELTRAATRANPDPASLAPATSVPAAPVPPGSVPSTDLDLISATTPATGDAAPAGEGETPAAEDPDADGDADDAQPGASRRPRIGWGGVLALLNVVLSGFILMLWGVPRLDGNTRAKNDGAGGRAGAGATRVNPNQAGATPAAGDGGTSSTATNNQAGAAAGLNAASGPTARRTQAGASGFGASNTRGDAGAGAAGVEVPELPQAIISVMPGQQAPAVTLPLPPSRPAVALGGATAGADAAIEAGNTAARATRDSAANNTVANSPAPRVPIAGADGVTMPERLAESHVRPTIAALADGEPVTGEVTLAATIRVDGSVADVQVLSSSRPGAGLEHAAADAVRRWRYKPATREGQPVDSRLTITVTFR